MIGIVYMIKNKLDGKVYIGQTRQTLNARMRSHRYHVKKGTHHHLYNAIRKYGWENFEYEHLIDCETIDELNNIEIEKIQKFKSNNREFGYNIDPGGNGCGLERASKISATKKKLFYNNPEIKKSLHKAHEEYFSYKENRKKHSQTIRSLYDENPDLARQKGEVLAKYYKDNPGVLSEQAKERWLNEAFAKKTGNAISAGKTKWHPPTTSEQKFCPKCSQVKLRSVDFHKSNRRKDGLESWCKSCRSTYQKNKRLSS